MGPQINFRGAHTGTYGFTQIKAKSKLPSTEIGCEAMKLSALWIKDAGSSETFILIYQTAWHQIPEDMYLHSHCY